MASMGGLIAADYIIFHNTMLNVWPHDSDWAMGSGAILFVTMSWNILAR